MRESSCNLLFCGRYNRVDKRSGDSSLLQKSLNSNDRWLYSSDDWSKVIKFCYVTYFN